ALRRQAHRRRDRRGGSLHSIAQGQVIVLLLAAAVVLSASDGGTAGDCASGDAADCRAQAEGALRQLNDYAAVEFYRRGCDVNDLQSCVETAKLYRQLGLQTLAASYEVKARALARGLSQDAPFAGAEAPVPEPPDAGPPPRIEIDAGQ